MCIDTISYAVRAVNAVTYMLWLSLYLHYDTDFINATKEHSTEVAVMQMLYVL